MSERSARRFTRQAAEIRSIDDGKRKGWRCRSETEIVHVAGGRGSWRGLSGAQKVIKKRHRGRSFRWIDRGETGCFDAGRITVNAKEKKKKKRTQGPETAKNRTTHPIAVEM